MIWRGLDRVSQVLDTLIPERITGNASYGTRTSPSRPAMRKVEITKKEAVASRKKVCR
jgi:hypothetical protein